MCGRRGLWGTAADYRDKVTTFMQSNTKNSPAIHPTPSKSWSVKKHFTLLSSAVCALFLLLHRKTEERMHPDGWEDYISLAIRLRLKGMVTAILPRLKAIIKHILLRPVCNIDFIRVGCVSLR